VRPPLHDEGVGERTEQAVKPRRLGRVPRRPWYPGTEGHLGLDGAEGRLPIEWTRGFVGATGEEQDTREGQRAKAAHQ
jgi:hypothetical protein